MRMFTYLPLTDTNRYFEAVFGNGRLAASIKAGKRAIAQHNRAKAEAEARAKGAVEGIPGARCMQITCIR